MAVVFTHLRSFHAVAQHHGFTAAAKAMNVSQPTVTSQVRELEERYGVELFLRQGRRVELTDSGKALFEISSRIIKLHEDAEELLSSSGQLTTGHLRIAAVGPFHATEMVSRFLARYPAIKITMLLGNSHQSLTRLLDLEADVAIVAHMVDDNRIYSVPFSTHEVVVFVNEDHPWHGRETIRIRELEDQRLILRETGSTTRRALEEVAAKANVIIAPFLEIGSREGVWKAVERGLGIGVVADFEFVAHPRLSTIRISDAKIATEYRVACLADRQYSRKIDAFLASVKDKD
ncbi:LysR substrate-binding domain-containing protein [Phyllobacterium myrsinacearum]|uniref:Aminoethylphosphonate catabolism LysR family transcriptional regulator n=1 Tax=Phyllobacterium myrsinacearum TaxID=28101 RepID=A0A839ECF0_9HYPH|nr:LysR substrate-binding domain-containing protein [Phyllobacterium myrsinacearum]MBA8876379.1 aminoethylphosphonate catabolism LysR family transcriptional regulator [Phyllobacterium myrsinacearum]